MLSVTRLGPEAVAAASGLNHISLLTGIPLEGGLPAFLISLGRAVGGAGYKFVC